MIKEIVDKAVPIFKRNEVIRAGMFGSVVRSGANVDRDVDFLIDFGSNRKSLFDFVDLQDELESALKRRVDLVFYNGLRPRIRDYVLKEHVPIL